MSPDDRRRVRQWAQDFIEVTAITVTKHGEPPDTERVQVRAARSNRGLEPQEHRLLRISAALGDWVGLYARIVGEARYVLRQFVEGHCPGYVTVSSEARSQVEAHFEFINEAPPEWFAEGAQK